MNYKRPLTKTEIAKLRALSEDICFNIEFMNKVNAFRAKGLVMEFLADKIEEELPLHKIVSVTWLIYEVANVFEDYELKNDLSEIVVEIEDFVTDIRNLIEKYLK